MIYQNIVTGVMLTICTLEDLADRRIPSSTLLLYSMLVAVGKPADVAAGSIMGIFCLLLSWMSDQSLGYGDSFIILISGISLGALQASILVLIALFLAGIWSAVKLIRGRAGRSSELPFLPFLLAGWMISFVFI